jgi:response regulator RpfG family c-di-GMP phosphodiesterase
MNQRILMVDDDPRILDALVRLLHDRYPIDTATSGTQGLGLVTAAASPYAVVVSDMTMPGMTGAEFLARAHTASPDTVQMILSGQAELDSTISAVNDGNLFRFLTKPCSTEDLSRALDAALAQYRLVHSERELLDHTLDGSVGVLTELMASAAPQAFARTETVKALAEAVLTAVPADEAWELRLAAMLGQLGLAAIPEPVLSEVRRGDEISPEALAVYRTHPQLAADLIRRIPRLERIADRVGTQPVFFADALQPQADLVACDAGSAAYAVVTAFAVGFEAGLAPGAVAHDLARAGLYPQALLNAAVQGYVRTKVLRPRQVTGAELVLGMVVEQDVVTTTGLTLIRSGEALTESMAIRLRHFAGGVGVVEPVNVLV